MNWTVVNKLKLLLPNAWNLLPVETYVYSYVGANSVALQRR